ncbi:MAG: tetraacyldisaccharide 4'-kinase [Rhizobiales bacterium]|nr:tetraacyldisaccharide 4'-kinase [Hyphomicrobiales bacterium]
MLGPLGRVHHLLARRRMRASGAFRAPVPVICVGNFTAGGAGKTPVARFIAEEIAGLDVQPVFLTRGYRGQARGPLLVDPAMHGAGEVGDEALLLAADEPTVVARDRVAGAKHALTVVPRAGAIIMDDGLQNGAVAKSLSIAVVDAGAGVGNGLVMPAGPLRADLSFQLEHVDAVIVLSTGAGRVHRSLEQVRAEAKGAGVPVLEAMLEPNAPARFLSGRRVVAFAGIGRPEKFFETLEGIGAEIVARVPRGDHEPMGEKEAAGLLDLAGRHDALLVTTQKDHVRLMPGIDAGGALARLRERAVVVAVDVVMARGDRQTVVDRLAGVLTGTAARV